MLEGLRKIPVKVYRSTDTNAPVLQGIKGSLKTLLKACLVTGYGHEDPLGWAMPFEETNRAAFQSTEETSNKHYLWVDHDSKQYNAQVAGAVSMTSLDDISGTFGQGYTPVSYQNYQTPWILIGHEKAFVLLMLGTYPVYSGTQGNMIYFGDVPSLFPTDVGNTILMRLPAYNDNGFSYSNGNTFFNNICFAADVHSMIPVTGRLWSMISYYANYFNNLGKVTADTEQLIAFPSYIIQGELLKNACMRALLAGVFIPSLSPESGIGDVTYPEMEAFVRCPVCETYGGYSSAVFVHKQYWLGV